MKTQSLTEIRSRALYNIYGDTTPAASLLARASYELLAILEDVQRNNKFYFSEQVTRITLPIGASSARVVLQNDGNGDDCIGEIYDVVIVDGDQKTPIPYITRREMYLVPIASGKPSRFSWAPKSEVYNAGVVTQSNDNLLFDRSADKAYSVDVFFKEIYMPTDWTNPTVFMAWTSLVLDELEEYLVNQLAYKLSVIAGNKDGAQSFSFMAKEALDTIYSKNDSKVRQIGKEYFSYKDI